MSDNERWESTVIGAARVVIPRLRAWLKGRVVVPGDDEYDEARTIFRGGLDRRSAAIARVADEADVSIAVSMARDKGLELAVRGGGHRAAGHSVSDGGIVIDLSEMRALQIDVEGRTAWAQTGLTSGEYTHAAGAHGLATGVGDTGSVGVGGITQRWWGARARPGTKKRGRFRAGR